MAQERLIPPFLFSEDGMAAYRISDFIKETIKGEAITLAGQKIAAEMPKENFEIGIKVNEEEVECLFENRTIINSNLNSNVSQGGIGFRTNSILVLESISVEEV